MLIHSAKLSVSWDAFLFCFIQDISEVKQELKKKEQVIRQLNRQCGQLESEQKMLLENVKDAENALRTAARCVDINLFLWWYSNPMSLQCFFV